MSPRLIPSAIIALALLTGCVERYRPGWLDWERGPVADLPLVRALPLRPLDFSFFGGGGKQALHQPGSVAPVHFAPNASHPGPAAGPQLDTLARRVLESRSRVVVSGFTDASGSPAYNLMLGERRALAVRQELIRRGVAPGDIVTVSFGEDMPVSPGAPAANRRVEFGLLQSR